MGHTSCRCNTSCMTLGKLANSECLHVGLRSKPPLTSQSASQTRLSRREILVELMHSLNKDLPTVRFSPRRAQFSQSSLGLDMPKASSADFPCWVRENC